MDDSSRAILEEIRDLQREHLAEYKRVAERSLALSEKAVARQEQVAVLYRRVVVAAALIIGGVAAFLAYTLATSAGQRHAPRVDTHNLGQ